MVNTKIRLQWDNVLTVTLMICALVTTGLVIRREIFVPATETAAPTIQRPMFIENWRSHLNKGVRLGLPDAPVQLIEFADFECPFCASFHMSLKTLRERYPTQVALSFVHYPLPMHRFAEPAARVAECSGEQDRFEEMHDLLFEQQNEFGLKSWSEFASEAGVADLAAFESCIKSKDSVQRIVEGGRLAQQLDIQGTPTLIINGWNLGRPPSEEDLENMVKAILAGESPVSDNGKID